MDLFNNEPVAVPKWDPTCMTISQYLKHVEKYELYLKKDKYNIILDFVNKWLNYESENAKLKSLTEFKNIRQNILLEDPEHNRKILKDNNKNLKKVFNCNFAIDDETDDDDITDKYIIYVVTKMLASIKFTLTHKKVGKKIFYSIKMK